MKNSLLSLSLFSALLFASCGPAAEDREKMHVRAKVFQDSIANVIRISMDQAAMKGPAPMGVVDTTKKVIAGTTATVK